MKVRRERSGVHCFDRSSGLHVLLDEVRLSPGEWSCAPRTLSVALTNACDLRCAFCYAPKFSASVRCHALKNIAREFDALGGLELTFGGGEPLLYTDLAEACGWIWENTALGISITTHGHHLTPTLLKRLKGHVSSLRFSIDAPEPTYSAIRGRPLQDLLRVIQATRHEGVPFGVNAVARPGERDLDGVADLAVELGAADLLIIPQHESGRFLMTRDDWASIDDFIERRRGEIQLNVTHAAAPHLAASTLDVEHADELIFAHLGADSVLKRNSYETVGIPLGDPAQLGMRFRELFNLTCEVQS